MPENVQGQFEKRLYLNTRIKSGGTYTTEGPHGLAFVEELNNYVTENQNTSITLGSSDHKVSILFDGPSTFVKDGIGISSSVPTSTYNRLYNNNGNLYWNESKISYKYVEESLPNRLQLGAGRYKPADIILSASDSIVFEGPKGRISFIYDTQIYSDNDVFINADYIHLNDSTLVVGPSNDVTFYGAASFNALSSFSKQGLTISSNTTAPSVTTNKLYNYKGDLYWNGTKLNGGGSTFNFIQEGGDWLRLGLSAEDVTVSGSRSVSIEGPNSSFIKLADYGIQIDTNQSSSTGLIILNGPDDAKIALSNDGIKLGLTNYSTATISINGPTIISSNGGVVIKNGSVVIEDKSYAPVSTIDNLYNWNGDLYWNGGKLAHAFSFIDEGAIDLYLGKQSDTDDCEHVSITADEVRINDSVLAIGPNGIEITSNDSIIISGPYNTRISFDGDGIHLGSASNPCTTTIEGPSIFKNTLKLDSLSSHPSNRTYKLYNKDGDLYWGYNKLVQTIGYINEDAGGAYIGKLNDSDFCQYVKIKADEVKINDTRIVVGPSKISLNAPEVKINDTSIVSGANEVSLNAYEVKINDTVVVAGPSDVRFYNSLFIVGPNGVTFNATTSFDGPVTFNGTAAFNGPISSGLQLDNYIPSSTSNRLYNNNGDLYWNGSKVGGSSYEHIVEVPDVLYFGWKGDAGTEIDRIETRGEYIETYFDTLYYDGYHGDATVTFDNIQSFVINGPGKSNLVIGPNGVKIASNNTIIISGPSATQISLANNGIHLGQASTPCTTTIEGPSVFKNTLELDSLGSQPFDTNNKLYNYGGYLYWMSRKLADGTYITEDASGLYLGKSYDIAQCEFVNIKADEVSINDTSIVSGPNEVSLNANEVKINGTAFISGPSDVRIYDSILIVGPNIIQSDADQIHFGRISDQPTSVIFNGPVSMYDPLYFYESSISISGPSLGNYKGDLYWNASKVTNSIINVPYQDVADEPEKRGLPLTLENNTIYVFDPDHDVDISEINVKHWNTPQLHLYFNNTSSGKTKMTFTYPSEWKWINQSTPPSSSDFKEGYLYCITLRSVANPLYPSSSSYYIVIANIAYEVPVDV